ncbi:transcription factor bHLH95-like [Mangifera indica]|uniref:transcription factor bHLH95-like n=1 Tax=Mangifera indica TaxID=29780 RepID=UPI001CFB4E74|nr:transcription factor bHLH95-like [Mangifera indica]
MSDEASLHHSFFWENQSWPLAFSDYYNSNINGTSGSGGTQERKKAPLPPSGSKNLKRGREGGDIGSSSGINKNNNDRVVKEGRGGNGGGESDDHEIHIWTERERRKKMRDMFTTLHELLPQLPPKADKSRIVDEAVKYIKTLQQTLQKLQKQKLERLQGVATFKYEPLPSIINSQKLALNSREAFLADHGSSTNFTIEAATSNVNSTNLVSASLCPVVFQTWTSPNVVLNICGDEANISVCSPRKLGLFTTICCVLEKHKIEIISAQVSSNSNRRMSMIHAHVNRGFDQLTRTVPVEEIYKQAADELTFWISSWLC